MTERQGGEDGEGCGRDRRGAWGDPRAGVVFPIFMVVEAT